MKGQIIQSLAGYYDVLADGKIYRTRARGNFRKRKVAPRVGDFIEFDDGYVLAIEPRKNQLVRPPVANVNAAIVVTAFVQPKFSANLLDRQLLMLEQNNIEAWLYFSKADLCNDEERQKLDEIAAYYQQFYPVFVSDEPAVFARIKEKLANQVVVTMGQTGAGKSTLLNHLDENLALQVGEVSKALKRGKHTTRKTALHQVAGGLLADTPGFSSFDLFDVDVYSLPDLFPDFHEFAPNCKFRGCLHLNEPKCAVKQAVADGQILQSRYDNYCLFNQLIKQQKPRYR